MQNTLPQPASVRVNQAPVRQFRRTASDIPAPVSAQMTERKCDKLRAAFAAGPDALLAFAKAEHAERKATAAKQWTNYRLRRKPGARFAYAITNQAGDTYELQVTSEGVKRFVGCPDQVYVDAINLALRCFDLNCFRVETKHSEIWRLRERAAAEGGLEWLEA